MKEMDLRIESDLLGEARIPKDAYWGIHTFRAMANFKFTGQPVSMQLVRALAKVKKPVARLTGNWDIWTRLWPMR